jgi:hypothetical protein
MVLRNPRHERAAQALARGASTQEAAIIGGLNPNGTSFSPNARRLCGRLRRVRVPEILQGAGAASEIEHAELLLALQARIESFCGSPRQASRTQLEDFAEFVIEKFARVPTTAVASAECVKGECPAAFGGER